ncbi:MAG: SpoIVB peptidase S55 domain-containing protein [Planctomycetota bacterium]
MLRLLVLAGLLAFVSPVRADPRPETYWNVNAVRPGMKGTGRTVVKGTKIESFDAEVLGVLKNSSPGRDLVLCMLSGLNLDKTGVIQGMSGSPIYIDGKLLGAVAYAWQFNKLPIAGVTPFSQMHEYAAASERRDLLEPNAPRRVQLERPLSIDGRAVESVTVANDFSDTAAADGVWLTPLRTPVCASGFSRNSLELLQGTFGRNGLVPMQGGGAGNHLTDEERNAIIEPGAGLAVAMVTGDFDMSGIGTVTHVEGKRVYGWGHPFMSLGKCEFPLMTGYTHAIMPRVSISFKMGTPLKNVGVVNADVSTCIAGWLDRPADLLPVSTTVKGSGAPRTYNVQIVRQKQMLPGLLSAVLTNSVDTEGDLPEEMTARLRIRFEIEGREPIVLDDVHSGSNLTGARGPQALYSQATLITQLLTNNNVGKIRVEKITAETEIQPGRRTAEIDSVEPESEVYAPGDLVKASVYVRPFKSSRQRVEVAVKLPADLPDGSYTAFIGEGLNNARQDLRDNPQLNISNTVDNLLQAVKIVASARRSTLVMRVATTDVGVAIGDQALPDLPPSMVQILGAGRRSGAQTIAGSVVGRTETPWALSGADSFRFMVSRNKKLSVVE